jgi:tripartite-type tricarboxylate transporter receptor subunit TctC
MVHVPYNGAASLESDLMGGHIAAGISAVSDLIEIHRAGKIRIIATSGAQRSPLLPDVSTFKEAGFPAVEATGWIAMYAPANTPRPVVEQWS